MRRKEQFAIRIPIPLDLPPSLVLNALQELTPFLRHHPTITHFDKVEPTKADRSALLNSQNNNNDNANYNDSKGGRTSSDSSSRSSDDDDEQSNGKRKPSLRCISAYDIWEEIYILPLCLTRPRRLRAVGYYKQRAVNILVYSSSDEEEENSSGSSSSSKQKRRRRRRRRSKIHAYTAATASGFTLSGKLAVVRRGGSWDDAFQGDHAQPVVPVPVTSSDSNGETEWDLMGEFEVGSSGFVSTLVMMTGTKQMGEYLEEMCQKVVDETRGTRERRLPYPWSMHPPPERWDFDA